MKQQFEVVPGYIVVNFEWRSYARTAGVARLFQPDLHAFRRSSPSGNGVRPNSH
jgi:hypothetical protein